MKAEEAYLRATAKASYEQMGEAQQRLLELLHYYQHRLEYSAFVAIDGADKLAPFPRFRGYRWFRFNLVTKRRLLRGLH